MKRGDLVRYWKGIKRGPATGEGVIRLEGVVGGHDVVWISGCAGCIAVSHCEPVVLAGKVTARVVGPFIPPKPKPGRMPRFELTAKTKDAEICLGWEPTMLLARSSLRGVLRSGKYEDAWYVDHRGGGRYDLDGARH